MNSLEILVCLCISLGDLLASHLTRVQEAPLASARQAVVVTLAVHHDDAAQRAPQPATETLHAGGIAAAAITN